MDFVKREDYNLIDGEHYKAYIENLQKTMEMEYQHAPISMEQLHQAMQTTLQIPLSPRQMSTLMLKTNYPRNEIPAHLSRTLDLDLINSTHDLHNLRHELTQNLRQEELKNIDVLRINDLELQNNFTQHILNEELRISNDLNQNLGRINDVLPQNLTMEIPQDLSHEIDLSHHLNRQNMDHSMIQEEARRLVMQESIDNQRLESLQRLDQNGQRLDGNLQRIVPNMINEQRLDHENLFPIPFHIKSEQEDDSYFHESGSQTVFANGLNGHLPVHPEVSVQNVPENQMYVYNKPNINIPALNPIDLYSRPQNYVQNYITGRENPQNLVVHRYEQFDDFTNKQDGVDQNGAKVENQEEPKENLKPSDQNKIFYNGFSQSIYEKIDEEGKLIISEDNSLIKGEYVCYKCNEIFPSKRILKQHAKSCLNRSEQDSSEKLGKYSCTQCSYRCQSPAILKIHERTHSGEKPFGCTFCDYKSGQKNNVAKHILVHMKEKPFRCQYCDYRCAQKNNLVVHERTHTGYKPFACPYCDYRTVQKPNLVKHMYLHTDQKPFSCDMCSYRCVQKTNLTKHKQRHLNERDGEKVDVKTNFKPYRPRQKSVSCPHCTYRCVQKSSFEKHMQFKHADLSQTGLPQAENLQENGENNVTNLKIVGMGGSEISEETIQNLSVKKHDEHMNSEKNYSHSDEV